MRGIYGAEINVRFRSLKILVAKAARVTSPFTRKDAKYQFFQGTDTTYFSSQTRC